MTDETPVSMFPDDKAIPGQYRISIPMEQRCYLCDGEIKEWRGPQQDVLSPICTAAGGAVGQKRIGSYPLLTEVQTLEVLDAAHTASTMRIAGSFGIGFSIDTIKHLFKA